ncbi:uncharacterized protein DNG_08223 [Cephalotrichum gorgonifer]|uniref:Kelch repeat-containing protein n=1 Tax=Cephalotrichum gorgonifer TaxID=2041049 RepID=A0AAE8SY55_9PEZI|nr:uncharacterized protein DNG_08223 [Cephalotrichum gorgonifer]
MVSLKAFLTTILAGALPGASSQSGSWSTLAPIPVGGTLQEHTTVALSDSLLAVLGGIVQSSETTDNVLLYNITADAWTQVASLPIPLNHINAVAVNGSIYVLGGLSAETNRPAVGDSFRYDPEADTWEGLEPMPEEVKRGAAVMGVYGDKVYLAGGIPSRSTSLDDVSVFDISAGEWLEVPEKARHIPEPRDHGGGAVIDGKFYVLGGRYSGAENVKSTVFILDLENLEGGWSTSEATMPTARGGLSAAPVGTKLYTFGGEGNPEEGTKGVFDDVEVYDAEADEWEVLEPMELPRHGASAAAVDGRIYIPGGGTQQGLGATDFFDVYEP